MKWIRFACVAMCSVPVFGCDGSAVVLPEDNTRVDMAAPTDPIEIEFLLREELHEQALNATDVHDFVRVRIWVDDWGTWWDFPVTAPTYTGMIFDLTDSGTSIDELSYWWSAVIPARAIEPYRYVDPGSYGKTVKFTVEAKDDSGTWHDINGLTVSWRHCRDLLEAGEDYCPYTREIHVRSEVSYKPNITQGRTDCPWDDSECSRCVEDLEGQFVLPGGIDIHNNIPAWPLPPIAPGARWAVLPDPVGGAYGPGNHNQGLAVLRHTLLGDGYAMGSRIVLTENSKKKKGMRLYGRYQPTLFAGGEVVSYSDWLFEEGAYHGGDGLRVTEVIHSNLAYGGHKHPGGAQGHGDLVVIAMEQPISEQDGGLGVAAAYFFRVNGMEPEFLHAVPLGGSSNDADKDTWAAATAGFVQLASGYYLLAVSGSNHGSNGIWFYESSDTVLNRYTTWNYVDFYDPGVSPALPTCDFNGGEVNNNCYVGAGGGINLVTGFNGSVYLIAMSSSDNTFFGSGNGNTDWEYLQVFRLDQNSSGKVVLDAVTSQRRDLNASLLDAMSFRFSGTTYTSSGGDLVILASERRTKVLDGGYLRGPTDILVRFREDLDLGY